MLQYSLEWAFFGRAQWGEFDTALWELEKAWSEGAPRGAVAHRAGCGAPGAGPDHPVGCATSTRPWTPTSTAIPSNVLGTAQHISTDIDFQLVDERTMAAALRRSAARGKAGA